MKKHLFTALAIFIMASCNSPKEKAIDNIRTLESKDSVFTPQHIEELKSAYADFASKYPDDELAPEYLFKAAQRCNVMAQHEEAIALFQQIRDKYPKSHLSEEALFMQGYIYENSIQDNSKAKQTYEAFVKQYPNSDLTEDAQYAIQNLGKSPEEIFESFARKDTAQANP